MMLCKTDSSVLFSSLYSSSLSLISGLFLLSPAMMAPHLAVGTMRNDKMGEPCFYLMGQNQTTVCSQVCPSSPYLFKLSFRLYPPLELILPWTPPCAFAPGFAFLLVCMLHVLSRLNRRLIQPPWNLPQCASGLNNSDWSTLITCCCLSKLSRLPAAKHTFSFFFFILLCCK